MTPDKNNVAHTRITKIFNYIGGTLIFFGVAYFIGKNWDVLTSFLKIFTTLGVAIATFTCACLLTAENRHTAASTVFFILSALFFPFGISVTLDQFNLATNFDLVEIIIYGVCFAIYFVSTLYFHRTILLFFNIIFGTMFFVALTNYLSNQVYETPLAHLNDYQFLIIGIYYLAMAYFFLLKRNSVLTSLLYFFGALFILIASFDLAGLLGIYGGTFFWEIVTPILILGCFFGSIPLRSKAILYLGAGALIVYIPCLTRKYSDLFGNFGWPLILVCAGLALMALGYIVVNVQKRIL